MEALPKLVAGGACTLWVSARAWASALTHTRAMAARRRSYDMRVAMTELGFAIAAFGCGLYDAPVWVTGLVSIGMLAYWNWSRRAVLKRLRVEAWASVSGAAFVVIIAIQAGAYWLGLGLGERMS